MSFIALLVALGLERLLSRWLMLREPRWLIAYARGSLALVVGHESLRIVIAVLAAAAPALAIAALEGVLGLRLHGVLRIAYSGVVLFFALGPRDLDQEVREYCRAARSAAPAAQAEARRIGAAMLEHDAAQRRGFACETVADAVFVQANNRLFGVVFWFVWLGPAGAALFRVTDILRREAIRRGSLVPGNEPREDTLQRMHGVLAWMPTRLLALTYGIAGSLDDAFSGWKGYLDGERRHFFDANDGLLVHAGRGALGRRYDEATDEVTRAELALTLVRRAFFAWLTALALLTLAAALA